MVPCAHLSQYTKWHCDRFGRVCMAHGCARPTDRQTDKQTRRPHYSVCRNRLHLASAAMRPNNNNNVSIIITRSTGICIPPPRYVLPVPHWRINMSSRFMSVNHALSVSPNSDESGKQSLYADVDSDRHRNLTYVQWPIANLP